MSPNLEMFNTNDLFNTINECYVYKAIVYSFQDLRYYTWWLTKTSLYQLKTRLPIQESYIKFWETWSFFASTRKWETGYCKGNAAKLYFLDHNPHNNKQSLKATKYLCNQVLQSPFSPIQLPQTRGANMLDYHVTSSQSASTDHIRLPWLCSCRWTWWHSVYRDILFILQKVNGSQGITAKRYVMIYACFPIPGKEKNLWWKL